MSDEIRWVHGSDQRKELEPHRGIRSTTGARTVAEQRSRRWTSAGEVHAVDPATGVAACGHAPRYVMDSRWEGNADPRCEACVAVVPWGG